MCVCLGTLTSIPTVHEMNVELMVSFSLTNYVNVQNSRISRKCLYSIDLK